MNNVHVLTAIPPTPSVRPILSTASNNVISINRRGAVTDEERDEGHRRQWELYCARLDNALKNCQPLRVLAAQLESEVWLWVNNLRR